MTARNLPTIRMTRRDYWDDCIACAAWGAILGMIVAFLIGAP